MNNVDELLTSQATEELKPTDDSHPRGWSCTARPPPNDGWMPYVSFIHNGGATKQRTEGGKIDVLRCGWMTSSWHLTAFISLGTVNMRRRRAWGWLTSLCMIIHVLSSVRRGMNWRYIHPPRRTNKATDVRGMEVVYNGWMIFDWRISCLHRRRQRATLNRSERRTENDWWYIWMSAHSSVVFGPHQCMIGRSPTRFLDSLY